MLKLSKSRNGIVLISVVFLTILIGMYVTSAFILSRGQLMTTQQNRENQLAISAARSGIDYALARLEENADWKGDGNGVVIDNPGLLVVEDEGNVVGLITYPDGARAQFRIRFNYQDGVGGLDEMDDPSTGMFINNRHVSANNIAGAPGLSKKIRYADGANNSVVATDPVLYEVPNGMVALVCEGRVAPSLSQASATDPNPPLNDLAATRVIEETHIAGEIVGDRQVEPALSMAAGRMAITLYANGGTGLVSLGDSTGEGQPTARSRDGIEVLNGNGTTGNVDGKDARLLVLDPTDPNQLHANLHAGVSPGTEDPNTAFYELTWAQVQSASASADEVKAGTYVYWESDKSVHYYAKNFEEYMSDIATNPADPGIPAVLPDGITFVPPGQQGPDGKTSAQIRFVVTEDLNVVQEGQAIDLSILPRTGAKESIDQNGVDASGGAKPTRTQTDWSAIMSVNGTPGNELFNNVISPNFQNTSVTPTGLNFLHELAPYGTVVDSSGSDKLVWDQNGIVSFDGNIRDLMDKFVRGNGSVSIENYDSNGVNSEIFSTSKSSQRGNTDAMFKFLLGGAGGAVVGEQVDELDLSVAGITPQQEPHGAGDFEVTFAPKSDSGLRINSPGDIRIAADVKGSGASIKAEGQIRFVGMGFDLATNVNEEGPSISLYAKDEIAISTLRKKNGSNYEYTGLDFKGIIYSWDDVTLSTGHRNDTTSPGSQDVRIQGTIVAYGGEPGVDSPGDKGGGNLTLSGDNVDLIFDPSFLVGVTGGQGLTTKLTRLSSSAR